MALAVVKKESTGELELRADGPGLGALARRLTASTGAGYLQLDGVDDPWPYDHALDRIEVVVSPEWLTITCLDDRGVLRISGTADRLAILAANVHDLASTGSTGDHLHIEWFPEHFYLSEDSEALVISFEG